MTDDGEEDSTLSTDPKFYVTTLYEASLFIINM